MKSVPDFFFIFGIILFIATTFVINLFAGLYLTAAIMIILGIAIARDEQPRE